MGYYKYITVNGYEFPVTIDGVIVNPRHHIQLKDRGNLDGTWEHSVVWAAVVFDYIYEPLSAIHCSGMEINSYEDAEQYVRRMKDVSHLDNASTVVRAWLTDGWLKLPQDIEWILDAAYIRLHPPIKPTPIKPPPPPEPGYVYLIQSPTGAYKIGRTKDPSNRAQTFAVKLPFEIEMIHTISCENYRTAERSLHVLYAAKRVNGEWFNLSPEDVEHIKSISRM